MSINKEIAAGVLADFVGFREWAKNQGTVDAGYTVDEYSDVLWKEYAGRLHDARVDERIRSENEEDAQRRRADLGAYAERFTRAAERASDDVGLTGLAPQDLAVLTHFTRPAVIALCWLRDAFLLADNDRKREILGALVSLGRTFPKQITREIALKALVHGVDELTAEVLVGHFGPTSE